MLLCVCVCEILAGNILVVIGAYLDRREISCHATMSKNRKRRKHIESSKKGSFGWARLGHVQYGVRRARAINIKREETGHVGKDPSTVMRIDQDRERTEQAGTTACKWYGQQWGAWASQDGAPYFKLWPLRIACSYLPHLALEKKPSDEKPVQMARHTYKEATPTTTTMTLWTSR